MLLEWDGRTLLFVDNRKEHPDYPNRLPARLSLEEHFICIHSSLFIKMGILSTLDRIY